MQQLSGVLLFPGDNSSKLQYYPRHVPEPRRLGVNLTHLNEVVLWHVQVVEKGVVKDLGSVVLQQISSRLQTHKLSN